MSSEIRVNKINNRAGLGTVTYTDTGIIVSGVSTASNFKTGTSDLHSAGLNVAYADVDDFVDVGNIIKLGNAGVVTATTFSTSNVDVTTDKIVVGTGVTIEANQVATGQATFTGIVTASAFKLSDGSNVGGVESDSDQNTVGGTNAGDSIVSGSGLRNTVFGYDAGTAITSGNNNTFFGTDAGKAITSTTTNTAIGWDALSNQSGGYTNTAIGAKALFNCQGDDNVALGYGALQGLDDGNANTAVGYGAGGSGGQNGYANTALGFEALKYAGGYSNSNYNVGVGWKAFDGATNSTVGVIAIGKEAGSGIDNGTNSIFIGYEAGHTNNYNNQNCIVIGANANCSTNSVDNEITLGDSNISLFRIPGINLTIGNNGANIAGVVTATSFSGDGSNLSNLPASAPVGGASTNTVFFENDVAVAVNYQITTNKNAMSAGPLQINAGIAVTVPSGSSWTIV